MHAIIKTFTSDGTERNYRHLHRYRHPHDFSLSRATPGCLGDLGSSPSPGVTADHRHESEEGRGSGGLPWRAPAAAAAVPAAGPAPPRQRSRSGKRSPALRRRQRPLLPLRPDAGPVEHGSGRGVVGEAPFHERHLRVPQKKSETYTHKKRLKFRNKSKLTTQKIGF